MGITLSIPDHDEADSTVLVRWCIDEDTAKEIKEAGCTNPYVLILLNHSSAGEVNRILVPLSEGARYIQFRHAREHDIYAFVVLPADVSKSVSKMKDYFLTRRNRHRYENELFSYEGNLLNHSFNLTSWWKTLNTESPCIESVDIDPNFFAKEAPRWLREIVGKCFEGKPKDQCHFRKRCMLVIPILPFWFVLSLLLNIFWALWSTMFGFKVNVKKVFTRVFCLDLSHISEWKFTENFALCGKDDKERGWGGFLILPVFWLVLACLWRIGALVVASQGLFLISWLAVASFIVFTMHVWIQEREDVIIQIARERARYQRRMQEAGLTADAMTCRPGVHLKAKYDAIPKGRRTIRLQFWHLKKKICRPFAA